jgi:(R)-amidase
MNNDVSVCQFEPTIGNIQNNIDRISEITEDCNSSVVVFPELCLCGYDMNAAKNNAITRNSERMDDLIKIAYHEDCYLVVGFSEFKDDELYNSLAVISPQKVEGIYRKQYLAGEAEKNIFTQGESGLIVETPAGKMGCLICYDMSFPESMIEYSNEMCDFISVISSWRSGWHDDWRLLSKARALENNCYIICSNQRGIQNGRFNDGESIISSPYGNLLVNLKQEKYHDSVKIDQNIIKSSREYNPVPQDRKERK